MQCCFTDLREKGVEMANYDNKLGEWFKQVEAKAQELKAKKAYSDTAASESATPSAQESVGSPRIADVEIKGPVREAPASIVATMEAVEVVADASLATDSLSTDEGTGSARLFAEDEAPQVEDFFSFLNRSSQSPVVEEVEERVFELPKEQSRLHLAEGTGEPRPVIKAKNVPQPTAQNRSEFTMTPAPPTKVETPKPVDMPKPIKAAKPRVEPQATNDDTQANWDRMPKHLQTLFGTASTEVAQNSYKAFKETREGLIQRLLDPTVSLEEAARILNVCPTTVRRYTNRGVLKHYRTAGNQRRFKLSDVLTFMDASSRREPSANESEA